jgi:hypothetical protein
MVSRKHGGFAKKYKYISHGKMKWVDKFAESLRWLGGLMNQSTGVGEDGQTI